MELLFAIAIGYLLGSIPFALVIGKVFFKKDIRNYGSKNLGGGNAGRVLGKKAGLAVMALDLLKVTFAVFLATRFSERELISVAAGLAAALGHCFPLWAGFKGGKAVATMYGFLFGMVLFNSYSFWIFLLPLIVFMVVLYLGKMVSLASICSAVINTVFIYVTTGSVLLGTASLIFTLFIIWRHRSNIERIMKGNENKITWM